MLREQDPGVAKAVAEELMPFQEQGDWEGALQVGDVISIQLQLSTSAIGPAAVGY